MGPPERNLRLGLGLVCLLTLILAACQSGGGAATAPPPATPSPLVSPAMSRTPSASPTTTPSATSSPIPPPSPTLTLSPSPSPPFNTLLFTGNIVPARCVQAKIDELGNPDYPYEEIQDLISQVDLAVGTLNGTLSDITVMTGCTSTFLLVGRSDNAAALARAGFDAMSVATNHIKNCGVNHCGDQAFLDTLDNLRAAEIVPIGAGNNLADALQPQVFDLRGVRFALVSLGEIESSAFAGPDQPGIAVLNEDNLRSAIAAARAAGDVVIALPHWGPEYSVNPNANQRRFARISVEAGADLVVGNHTHTVQALETLSGVPVFYGLGNFMFDQGWSRETSQGVALRVSFLGTTLVSYDLVPVHIDGDGRVHVAGPDEALEILEVIRTASAALP